MRIPGDADGWNKNLEFASRVADFLELGELMALDALYREESCGGHFREEYQTEDGEAQRDDEVYNYAAAWSTRAILPSRSCTKNPWNLNMSNPHNEAIKEKHHVR